MRVRNSFIKSVLPLAMLFVLSASVFAADKATQKATLSMTLHVKGMVCGSCSKKVGSCLTKMKGVKSAKVNLDENQAVVEYDPKKVKVGDMISALKKKGFDATEQK